MFMYVVPAIFKIQGHASLLNLPSAEPHQKLSKDFFLPQTASRQESFLCPHKTQWKPSDPKFLWVCFVLLLFLLFSLRSNAFHFPHFVHCGSEFAASLSLCCMYFRLRFHFLWPLLYPATATGGCHIASLDFIRFTKDYIHHFKFGKVCEVCSKALI